MIIEVFAVFLSSIAGYGGSDVVATTNQEVNASEVQSEVVTQTTNLEQLIDIQTATAAARRSDPVAN